MRILLSTIFLSLFCSQIFSQEFQRQYKLQNFEECINIDGIQTTDMGFASINGISLDTSFRNIFITKYDKKGTQKWNRQLFFDAGDSINVEVLDGSLLQGKDDNLFYTLTVRKPDGGNKLIGALTIDGDYLWSQVVEDGQMIDQTAMGANLLAYYYDQGFIHSSTIGIASEPILVVNYVDPDGFPIFMKEFETAVEGNPTPTQIGGLNTRSDSSIMITGSVNELNSYFLTAFDSLQNTSFASYFRDTTNTDIQYFGHTVKNTVDTGFVVAGRMIIPVMMDTIFSSFVAKHDSLGNVVWAKRIGLGNNETSIINGLVVDADNSITVGISAQLVDMDSTVNIIAQLDGNGDMIWNKLYDKSEVNLNEFGSFSKAADGGYVLFNTGIRDTLERTNLIKTNSEGETTCENELNQDIFVNIEVHGNPMDAMLIDNNELTYENYGLRADNFNSFAVPTLTILAPTVCPNLPIDTTLTAQVTADSADIVSYLWNTGDTTATIRVFDDEMYDVIVTMKGEVCYTLCDTGSVNLFMEPRATLSYNCVGGTYDLNLDYQTIPDTTAEQASSEWSTGDMNVDMINVADQGTYAVTVTDVCGQTVVASVEVDPDAPDFNPDYDCREDGIYLVLAANDPIDSILNNQILWSTGDQDNGKTEVLIDDKITYTVTITDICNEEAVESINVPLPPVIETSFICLDNGFELNLTKSGGDEILDINWSTNNPADTTLTIQVTESGTYYVTLTDFCRETVTDSIEVPFLPSELTITPDFSKACNGASFILTADADGPGNYNWETGEVEAEIEKFLPGTYSVTLTDMCNKELTQSITVLPEDLPIDADSIRIGFVIENICESNTATLFADVFGEYTGISWSTGETTDSITVPIDGQEVTVTAFDECGNVVDDIIANFEKPNALDFPDIFFPNKPTIKNGDNLYFGGFVPWDREDTLLVESAVYANIRNFELHVFNRWGQEVFSSTDVLDRWDGTDQKTTSNSEDRNEALPEVYVWYATWEDEEGCTYEAKDDVTLLR